MMAAMQCDGGWQVHCHDDNSRETVSTLNGTGMPECGHIAYPGGSRTGASVQSMARSSPRTRWNRCTARMQAQTCLVSTDRPLPLPSLPYRYALILHR